MKNRPRLESVDILRGLVMVIMALDHTRDFFGNAQYSATDLTKTTAALFFTRWITHYCAPVFVFLAGTSAFLWQSKGRTRGELSRFLLTRGLWLVFLELTIIHFGWSLDLSYRFVLAQVFWAIGWSMVALAGLIWLPLPAITGFGLVMIAGHNLFDGVKPATFGRLDWLWSILHAGGRVDWGTSKTLMALYPLIPWIGVMAAGYVFGTLLTQPCEKRRPALFRLGLGLTLAFVVLRAINIYGDPHPWSVQSSPLFTLLSFLNVQKYPPSLLYLLVTLGPALLLLACLDRPVTDTRLSLPERFLQTFGRVPLFYYVLHLYLLHFAAVGVAVAIYGPQILSTGSNSRPPDYGYNLPVVYAVWMGAVLLLYPACRWFAGVKQRSRAAWLTYL